MRLRSFGLALLAASVLAVGAGCDKSTPSASSSATRETNNSKTPVQAPATPVGPAARIHWVGLKRLATEPSATNFMAIWHLPETERLEAQTLNKLALALASGGRFSAVSYLPDNQTFLTNYQALLTNYPAAPLLRPLLEDIVQEESYLEIRNSTNEPGELALAIRLNEARSGLWQTNLAGALAALTGQRPTATTNGWQAQIQPPASTNPPAATGLQPRGATIQFTRSGDWTVLELNFTTPTPSATAPLAATLAALPATNLWLQADLDLPRISNALACDWGLPADWPRVSLAISGEAQAFRTLGQFDFPRPLPLKLEPWSLPTNIVRDPVVSFTAVRGIEPWLNSLQPWQNAVGASPNQVYLWAVQGAPTQMYFTAPLADASNVVWNLSQRLLTGGNAWIASNALGKFERSTEANAVAWVNFPFAMPYLRSLSNGAENLVFGGLGPMGGTNRLAPDGLFQELVQRTNLVAYSWELTGPEVENWIYVVQLARLVTHHRQLAPQCASMKWFHAIEPKLGNCVTLLTQTGPAQLSLVRNSTLGLSALELHGLADWLESPQFPRGLFTFLTPRPRRPAVSKANKLVSTLPATNSPSATK